MDIPQQPGPAAAVPPAGTGGAPDSGVETEDQESNDSSLSNVSLGGPIQPQVQAQPVVAISDSFQVPSLSAVAIAGSSSMMSAASSSSSRNTPEPLPSFLHPNNGLQPPPSVTEDGYLGDCSSDGGNEKNFPMPSHLLKRLVNGKPCHCHPESKSDCNSNASDSEAPDPPAGLSFQNVSSTSSNTFGYQVLPQNFQYEDGGGEQRHHHQQSSSNSRKMKSSVRTKIVAKGDTWYTMTAALTERKLRTAACTNNTDTLQRLLANGVNVNCSDGQQRTALHFGASKGYSEVVNTLLQYGADPNAKDILGNTALHLAACTNHIEVVTLLLRAGTDVTTLDNSGRTPIQLAQSKLKLLQKNSSKSLAEMTKVIL